MYLNNLSFYRMIKCVCPASYQTCLFTTVGNYSFNYNSVILLPIGGKRKEKNDIQMSGCPTFRQPLAFVRSCLEASLKCVTTAIQRMWFSGDACTQPRATDSDPLGISELNRSLLIQPNLRNNKLPDSPINFSENCICKKI